MYAIFTLLRSPVALRIGLGIALAVGAWSAYLAVDHSAYSRGVRDAEDAAQLVAYAAAEEAHQFTLAEIERGDALSKELLETQRRLDATKTEYITYANSIVGHCPDDLRVLAHYAARGEPMPVPEAARPPVDAAPPVSAAAIGANLAENYARCFANAAQLRALIQWHEGAVK